MKNFILYSLILSLGLLSLSSCEDDDSVDTSVLTYYVSFEMHGDEFTIVPIGTEYVEQGVTAFLAGEDVTSTVSTSGSVDDTKAGIYYITYSAVSKDGFESSVTRTVAVCDPTIETNIEGKYKSGSSYRMRGGVRTDYSGYNVDITYMAPGIFKVSDIMGGYYSQRYISDDYPNGYGSAYGMVGFFQLFADNHVECLSGDVAGWGDSFSSFENGVYDPETQTISYVLGYAGMLFYVTLEL